MPEVFVGIGSNADPVHALREAVAALGRHYPTLRSSSVYRGPAAGVAAADYFNMVVTFSAAASVDALRDELAAIERVAGRNRADPAVCQLDLDLLLYGLRVDAAQRLPRPGVLTQPFVLEPLAELAPALVHPLTGVRYGSAWSAVTAAALTNLGDLAALG
jgi:2-amino-4-hydroxy-6-hydroxymethyldihydropteridine diphosphokinase